MTKLYALYLQNVQIGYIVESESGSCEVTITGEDIRGNYFNVKHALNEVCGLWGRNKLTTKLIE